MTTRLAALTALSLTAAAATPQPTSPLPDAPLKFGAFVARFGADGSFTLEGGERWPAFKGRWKADGAQLALETTGGPKGCEAPARYTFAIAGTHLTLERVSDECQPRGMILDHSTWMPASEAKPVATRTIVRSAAAKPLPLPKPAPAAGSWPSFRGPLASGIADGQDLPDAWDVKTGENVLWRARVPGLAHSSPIVWGERLYVTSAISGKGEATFRPGLYGDGDASDDRSKHRFMLYAFDKKTGARLWERAAYEGEPLNKRHIKSTYASATPATDGRVVVAWFGSQGVHAYDVLGNFLWKVDLGRVDMGAYDIPTYEWGPASSPILWNGLVIVQCDTQADSFLLALDAATGATVWKTEREEPSSWGTPTVAATPDGPVLVTNASNFIRGNDPKTGMELWRLGRSSKITAPTPIFAEGLFVIASGRAPERPIFVVRPGARGDLTLGDGQTSSEAVAWSKTGRGSYMPTPLVYRGLVYVLANNGVFDAYDLKTGAEIYRERLPNVGSGFSASPIAADGKLYLSSEDGEMLVIAAGREFKHVATHSMGELLMATPALSEGVLFVRSAQSLFAISRKP